MMKTRLWRRLILLGVLILVGAGRLDAAPLDACQPAATENWTTVSNWSCGRVPTSADAVTIPLGVTLTLNADGDVGDLTLAAQTGTRLSLGDGVTLNMYGALATISSTTSSTITGNGRLRLVGTSRTLFTGDWAANSPGLRLEIALSSGAIGASDRAVKGGEILISNGTYSTSADVRPDSGSPNTGRLDIAAGATLLITGNIERTGTAGTQAASVIVSGTLESSGTRISANAITIADGGRLRVKRNTGLTIAGAINYATGGTLEYAGSTAQTTGGELTTTVANLTVANAAGVTLARSTTVNGQLALNSGGLATNSYTLTLGSAATCSGDYEVTGVVQRLSPALGVGYCFGHANTALTFTSGAAPTDVAVRLSRGTPPFAGAVARQYTLHAPGFSGVATVRLHYLDNELNGATEANLRLWRLDGSQWRLMGRSAIDTTNNYVELTGVTAFSDWAIAEDGEPTAVTVVDFGAELQPDGVHLAWETADETLNAGFHILRSESVYLSGERITVSLIPSQTAGGAGGARYTFVDTMPSSAATRFYWLEDVELTGATARHGPVVVVQTLVWLPLVASGE